MFGITFFNNLEILEYAFICNSTVCSSGAQEIHPHYLYSSVGFSIRRLLFNDAATVETIKRRSISCSTQYIPSLSLCCSQITPVIFITHSKYFTSSIGQDSFIIFRSDV
jgi:hypothetical protein